MSTRGKVKTSSFIALRFQLKPAHVGTAFALLLCLTPLLRATDPPPLTDNRQPPYLAVWKEPKYQPEAINQYNTWLHRTRVWPDVTPGMFGAAAKTWDVIELPFDPLWSQWMTEHPGCRAILGLTMLPSDGSTLAQGATGAYNRHFTALAKNLVANHLGQTIIWMSPTSAFGVAWKVSNAQDAANFVLYWRQIVSAMRAVPGAEHLQFDWVCPDGKINYPVEQAYPGKDVVDYIGITLGEGNGNRTIYPYPTFASDSEQIYRQKKAWDLIYHPLLDQWSAFAKAHGKPFSIARWNLSAGHVRDSGLDAPYFIKAMGDYIKDPAHHIYFASYMEYYHYSWLSATMDYKTVDPKSTEAFHKVFALPDAGE